MFVLPVAPKGDFFSAISSAGALRRYVVELVYWLRRHVGGLPFVFPKPVIGHAAISGFSAGGSAVAGIVQSASIGGFPELREVYCLDAFVGKTEESFRSLSSILSTWWEGDTVNRCVRMYTKYSVHQQAANRPSFARSTVQGSDGTIESSLRNATFAFTPLSFWATVCTEHSASNPISEYFPVSEDKITKTQRERPPSADELHQMMPAVFLEHALRNSGFPDV